MRSSNVTIFSGMYSLILSEFYKSHNDRLHHFSQSNDLWGVICLTFFNKGEVVHLHPDKTASSLFAAAPDVASLLRLVRFYKESTVNE